MTVQGTNRKVHFLSLFPFVQERYEYLQVLVAVGVIRVLSYQKSGFLRGEGNSREKMNSEPYQHIYR
eukprot:COSAG02_NODE_1239_length_13713_cov_37.434259_14_plen_67_part_00